MKAEEIFKIAYERIQKAAQRRKKRHQRNMKGNEWNIEIGEKVLLRNQALSSKLKKENQRLMVKFVGPYKVIAKFGTDTVEVADLKTGISRGRFHKSLLRSFRDSSEYRDEEEKEKEGEERDTENEEEVKQ